ncbi:MAG: hypothetical protein IKS04_04590 [Clostridia bacterium]|nr:hypothetical protein [Clostridia bacterium]MBR6702563.1 hypothetical protein [Clostridia bacterium]
MKKIIAVIMAVSMLLALASCGAKQEDETTTGTTAEATTEPAESVTEESTEEDKTSESGNADENGEDESESSTETDEKKKPETKAEILAVYAEVMNKVKKDAPGFQKVEYQELPEEGRVITSGKTMLSAGLSIASNFMTSKEDAEKKPDVYPKGNDMNDFPIRNTPKGCMLEDPEFLKTAKYEELPDGNVRITVVTGTEKNPEPAAHGASTAPSKTGGIITPISKKEIDEKLNGGIVSAVFKDVNYSLTFHDCESVLVFNPENNRVVSLIQTTRVSISGSGKSLGATLAIGNQDFVNHKIITNIKY